MTNRGRVNHSETVLVALTNQSNVETDVTEMAEKSGNLNVTIKLPLLGVSPGDSGATLAALECDAFEAQWQSVTVHFLRNDVKAVVFDDTEC